MAAGLLGGPRAYLDNQQNHWNPLRWAYWAYLGPTLPTSKIIGTHCSGPTGPTLGIPWQPAKSLESIALGLLGLLGPTLAASKIIGINCSRPTWGLPRAYLPTNKNIACPSLFIICHYLFIVFHKFFIDFHDFFMAFHLLFIAFHCFLIAFQCMSLLFIAL